MGWSSVLLHTQEETGLDFVYLDYPGQYGIDCHLADRPGLELQAYVVAVEYHSRERYAQFACYLLVYESFDHQSQHFLFTGGKSFSYASGVFPYFSNLSIQSRVLNPPEILHEFMLGPGQVKNFKSGLLVCPVASFRKDCGLALQHLELLGLAEQNVRINEEMHEMPVGITYEGVHRSV